MSEKQVGLTRPISALDIASFLKQRQFSSATLINT